MSNKLDIIGPKIDLCDILTQQAFTSRSSRSQMFFKIGVLKNFANPQQNTCVRDSF